MPNIKVTDWTKTQLDEIRDEEDHTTYDSVVKSLINCHESRGDA